jgi:hypothetical protein
LIITTKATQFGAAFVVTKRVNASVEEIPSQIKHNMTILDIKHNMTFAPSNA